MIRLNVEEYCQQCLDFSPDVIEPTRAFLTDGEGEAVIQTDTIIQCEYRKRCANIKRYLDHQSKEAASG